MEPSFDAWSLFFLIAASQGFFLSILLFARRSKTNDLIAWLILSFSACIGYYVVFWTGYYRIWPWQLGVFQGMTLLFGPLTYAYIRSDKKKTVFDVRHLIPFSLYTIYFLADHPPRFLQGWILAMVQITHLFVYAFLIWKWLSKNRSFNNGALKRFIWQKKIAIAYTGYSLSFLFYFVLVWSGLIKIEYDYMISLVSAGLIYFIGYYGFVKPEFLRMNEDARYDKSTLNDTAALSILDKLKMLMTAEQMYLEPSLKLQDVANKMELQPHHISQVVNELEEKNFSDFINEYRISTAIKLLKTTDNKVIHIAFDSGFNNKASFNNAFKKVTGMSPSQYREIHQTITMR